MMKSAPHCRTIPAGTPFLSTLAAWLLNQYGKEPLELSRVLVLLPNRRACRSLREAFLALAGGKPLLLPRMQPIGELEEESWYFTDTSLPPAIAPLKRELMLAELVMSY